MAKGDNIPVLDETVVTATIEDELNDANKFKINGADYYCYFEISTSEFPQDQVDPDKQDPTNTIRLTKSAIVNLDLQENFFEPFCAGHITVNNPYDYIEDNHYTTGDGDDYLHVVFCEWETFKRFPEHALTYTFVITDEGNSVSKSDRSNNFKTYKLLDKNYAKLNEAIPFNKVYPTNAMREAGDTTVGSCIRQLLVDVLGADVIDNDFWDVGSHKIGEPNGEFVADQEYITCPLSWRYSDLLKYLLRINYSTGGDGEALPVQCVLNFDRTKQKYSLEAIDKIFKDNKALTIEGFGLGDLTGSSDNNETTRVLGTNKNNPKDTNVPVNQNEGLLKNANVTTPMVNYGNEFFINYSAGYNDGLGGQQNQHQVSLEEIRAEWKKSFVDVFNLVGGKPQPFVPLNKIRGRTIRPMIFPFNKDQIINIAKAQMVSNLTFLNLQLTLDNQGDTFRQPGKFIDLFKLTGGLDGNDSPSDAKILGRWFVTKVHHRFFKDSYENVIQCVKTYVGPDVDSRFDDASLTLPNQIPTGKQIRTLPGSQTPNDLNPTQLPGGNPIVLT
tara:strand:- start:16694 stop:18361 length:1668 start_codon:yes stop_codon:yes gene_type:complete